MIYKVVIKHHQHGCLLYFFRWVTWLHVWTTKWSSSGHWNM